MKEFLIKCGKVGVVLTFVLVFYLIDVIVDSHMTPASTPQSTASPVVAACNRPAIVRDNISILVNEHRLANSLPQLAVSEAVESYAQARADEIASTGQYTHDTQLGSFYDWQKKYVKTSSRLYADYWRESLMKDAANACDTVDAWKKSPTHNDSLLSTGNYVLGIGVNGSVVALELVRIAEQPTVIEKKVYVQPQPQPKLFPRPTQPTYTTCTSYEILNRIDCKTY